MEEWKEIEGYPNYMVSNMGRIKSLNYNHTGEEKIMKGSKNRDGYLRVLFSKEGKKRTIQVHRLIATAFIPNPDNLPQVNHRNEDKTDNRVENLEWCDCRYNINYGSRNEKMAKSRSIPILQFTKQGEFVKRWNSTREAEREIGINQSHISKCLKGKYKTAGGFIWGYEKDYERIPFKVFDLEIYKKIA